jgi:drug/metabolite transporter (DMT)-like permease
MGKVIRRILPWLSALALFGGLASWGAYALIGSYVDDQGLLHEPFFLIPTGWLFIFASLAVGGLYLVVRLMQALRKAKSQDNR